MAAKEPIYTHKLRYNPSEVPRGVLMLDHWPELQAHAELKELAGSVSGDKVLRYAVFAYDRDSALVKLTDLVERKREALRLAGFTPADPGIEGMVNLSDETTRRLVMAWLRLQDNPLLGFWHMGSEMVWQDIAKLAEPIVQGEGSEGKAGDKETDVQRAYALRGQLFDKLQERIEKLGTAEKQLFKDDPTLKAYAVAQRRKTASDDSVESLYLK